jgi:16S rRNA (guanine966-N2)-methyltransferase
MVGTMRIIAGIRARSVLLGPGDNTTRPITDRVKESLFAILEARLDEAVVADLFCGTGSMGLEALSRGASHAVMIDSDKDAIERLRQNIAKLRFEDKVTVVRTDAFRYGVVSSGVAGASGVARLCNVVFVDPPYKLSRESDADSLLGKLLVKVSGQVADGATVVVRQERKSDILDKYGLLCKVDRREYGSMALNFLEKRLKPLVMNSE